MGYEIVFVLPLLLAAFASMVMCAVCIIAQRNGAGDKIEAAFVKSACAIGGVLFNGLFQLILILLVNLANKF